MNKVKGRNYKFLYLYNAGFEDVTRVEGGIVKNRWNRGRHVAARITNGRFDIGSFKLVRRLHTGKMD